MKNFFRQLIVLGFILFIPNLSAFCQVAINTDGSAPNTSAMLDVKSNTKGFLPPRMTTSERTGILSPATGLVVFDTDANCLYLRTATAWVPLFTSATAWGLKGNAGTTPGTNFIGTTDAQPLIFKVNNQRAGYIDYDIYKANAGFGYQIFNSNTTGFFNTANGYEVLFSNTTGSNNTAQGYNALYTNTLGYQNTANGALALGNNTTGYYNVAVGYQAGITNTSGQKNTYLGYNTDGSTTLTNATAIGANALVTQSNSLVLGDNNVNVGIGTSAPANKLEVANGGISLYNTADSKRFVMNYDQTGHYFYIDEYGAGRHFTILNGGNVGIGTTSPAAKLDVNGSFKLFNGTQAAGRVLTSDANGYANWQTPAGTGHYIGESYGGGTVFYVYDNGQHGLITATADQSSDISWFNGSYTTTNAVRDQVHAGQYNTERIIMNQGPGSYAAQICANYQGGGYGDWYLPSKQELNLLYLQKAVVGGFASEYYWSSSEYGASGAWSQYFYNGFQGYGDKYDGDYVRAIRAF